MGNETRNRQEGEIMSMTARRNKERGGGREGRRKMKRGRKKGGGRKEIMLSTLQGEAGREGGRREGCERVRDEGWRK